MKVTIEIDTDPPAREIYTGRTLIAVDRRRPAKDIQVLVSGFLGKLGLEFGRDTGAEPFTVDAIWTGLGAAVLRTPADVTREFVNEMMHIGGTARASFEGLVHGPEHFLYSPRDVNLPADPNAPSSREILDRMGVRDGHSGKVRVLVLDSGFDKNHRDFAPRGITPESFVPGDPGGDDLSGHGTHCAGLIGGPRRPAQGTRYGVAPDAILMPGRVIAKTTRSAVDGAVLDALEKLQNAGIAVVNMSFGVDVKVGGKINAPFEEAANRALVQFKMLLVASAGNDPLKKSHPVEHPANCPSVVAVGALDQNFEPAAFSCVSINPDQLVDITAPGYLVRSAFGGGYKKLSGTSMSAALVSGVAALWAASSPQLRGTALREAVLGRGGPGMTVPLGLHGLAQAPPI